MSQTRMEAEGYSQRPVRAGITVQPAPPRGLLSPFAGAVLSSGPGRQAACVEVGVVRFTGQGPRICHRASLIAVGHVLSCLAYRFGIAIP